MKKVACSILSIFALLMISFQSIAQEATTYQLPPKEIADLLLAAPTPSISVDGKAKYMLVMERPSYPLVEELGQAEFKIAGLRLNPNNFSPTRQNYIKGLTIKDIATSKALVIKGMPASIAALSPTWNPSENKIAFYNVSENAVDVYVIDLATLTGACVVALGYDYTGLVSNDDKFAREVIHASNETDDRAWRLPSYPELKDSIKT